ncbi:hypothetical protein OBK28_02345 [Empedobacter falsenii]|uniref:Right-handed parallel beta-helix repeat-containing protein n=2 Tax=Empedobacter TaxID=59734 RepID=A0ABY8V7V0_9FLAO|nr:MULTISPECIES: hypothetical protein [Empedobacter]MCA4776823.1 hypothetical protein [Empedobacter stercoris]MCA4809152.1 hypothetical protein [Empedobacter stercoris]MDM1522049.1 hypothetical protein [Empedobacter sp. 225-1]MDM1542177.1 hypothetical protein [Empedobacter sp. 189-2]NOJ76265.1 hypothetical protein [Empedobacter stercoris]
MKKSFFKLLTLALFVGTVSTTFISCSSDDDSSTEITDPSTFVVDRNNLKGEITKGEVVLESGTYKLTGRLIVREGAILRIKPGVVIEATNPSSATAYEEVRFISIAQGAKIFVEGTESNPVIMTATNKAPGKWGGLVLAGKAPINKGTTATTEVGGELAYGGSDVNDNSGSIQYLRIEYSGFAYNADKEFNGLSLFGVGKGTVIKNVQAYESSDDGFEWFGGTVDASNLVVVNTHKDVGDDMFDWTEGWNGTGQNWYGKKTNAGNRGIEADNNSNNPLATPISSPTIKNMTLIGAGKEGAEPQGIKLRVGSQGTFDNIVLSNWNVGFDIQQDESIAAITTGKLKATNVKFDNVTTKSVGKNTKNETVDVSAVYTESSTANGAGNGTATPDWAKGWTLGL